MASIAQQLKDLIADGKTEQAIEQLRKLSPLLDKDFQQDILFQAARFKAYQKEKRQGTSAKEEQEVTLNKVNLALLELIRQLPDTTPVSTRKIRGSIFKWTVGTAAVLAFLALVVKPSVFGLRGVFSRGHEKLEIQGHEPQKQDAPLNTALPGSLYRTSDTDPAQDQSSGNTATTSGKNSPAIVNTGENAPVNINYGNVDPFEETDTSKVEKDSLNQ